MLKMVKTSASAGIGPIAGSIPAMSTKTCENFLVTKAIEG